MVPPPALLSRTWLSIGRYAVSVTPVKTLSRPASSKVVSPIATSTPPVSGSTIISSEPVSNSTDSTGREGHAPAGWSSPSRRTPG